MSFWDDIKSNVFAVDDKDFNAVKALYDNCKRMANDNNNNVELATLSVDKWFGDIIKPIFSSVDYVSTGPMALFYYLQPDGSLFSKSVSTDIKGFDSFEDMRQFITQDRFNEFLIFSICKMVNLDTLDQVWSLRYAEIESSPDEKRDKKIDFLINGIDNN